MYVAQGPVTFHRAPPRLLNIQLVVKPNGQREALLSTSGQISACGQQLRWELDEKVCASWAVPPANIWEAQLADQAVESVVGWRCQAQLLQRLLLLLVEGVCRVLPVCLNRLTHRIGGGRGFCFDISFLSCLRIKLRTIRGQRLHHYNTKGVSRVEG